jgi:apolipoprotein D and lipocalin family protein
MQKALFVALAAFVMAACQSQQRPPLALADEVDIPRFMGDWYVIAAIPTPFEREAYNAVESYRYADAGYVDTRFTYNKGAFDGPEKTLTAKGYVREEEGNGAVWGMQFVWPFKADYRVMYVSPDYSVTIIGRQARDYLWVMARTPQLPEDQLADLLRFCEEQGYDLSELRLVPQEAGATPGGAAGQPAG